MSERSSAPPPSDAEPIISVSGLRGIVGRSLTGVIAARYARAFAAAAPPGPIVITRDGRPSGPALAEAIKDGLGLLGRDTIDAGVAATPTTGVLVRRLRAAGGIQISASHNPAEYNGMKLFSADGRVITAALGAKVMERFRADAPSRDESATAKQTVMSDDPHADHLALVLARVDVEHIRQRRFKVVLDANHGAGALLGRRLLEELGCEVRVFGAEPDGAFEHSPEPTAENLATVLPRVMAGGADVCFCQDPDADRLALVDAKGRYLGEEYTVALCVDHVLRQEPGAIVTNCSTSRMSEDLAEKYSVPFYRSAVGEANVVEVMESHDAVLGGEGNGGVIDPSVGMVRDSFIGMALVLDAMASRERPLAALAAELPKYAIVKSKIVIDPSHVTDFLQALARHFPTADADRLDGLRLDWPDRWLLVRPSNTEPIVRAVAEAGTSAAARKLCDEAASVCFNL